MLLSAIPVRWIRTHFKLFRWALGRSFFIIGQGLFDFLSIARITFLITANRENGKFHVNCAGGLTIQAKPVYIREFLPQTSRYNVSSAV